MSLSIVLFSLPGFLAVVFLSSFIHCVNSVHIITDLCLLACAPCVLQFIVFILCFDVDVHGTNSNHYFHF